MEPAPTAPGNLKIGSVHRRGENIQYDFPDQSDSHSVLIGRHREAALSWDPSEDNTGVAGYNIYRKGYGKDLEDYAYWEEKEHPVGSATDNFFVDSGLRSGAEYIYYVEAFDKEGKKTRSEAAYLNTRTAPLCLSINTWTAVCSKSTSHSAVWTRAWLRVR